MQTERLTSLAGGIGLVAWLACGAVCATGAEAQPYPVAPGEEAQDFRDELAKPLPARAEGSGSGARSVRREPWVRDRISRCYFSPIKRPPFNRDELDDGVDYYPDAYLARLADENVNGLWITVEFADLLASEKKLSKLSTVTRKCRAHGIGIWLFAIEPKSVSTNSAAFRAAPELYPRPNLWARDSRVMCASDPRTAAYLRDCASRIFCRVPELKGMLMISHGERKTSCFSDCGEVSDEVVPACSRCSATEPWRLHNALAEALVSGMREGNPEARLLSWLYHPGQTPTRAAWILELARHVPEGVTMIYNFESGAISEQLGKSRCGGDYWLSFVGPSAPFAAFSAAARSAGCPFGAKIQVGCSHEIATLPYVPVPGLLYRKYRAMREAGVSSVLQCWYFGNCPGLMNRAAGELSFSDFAETEDQFLRRLAGRDWGDDAEEMASAWKALSDAYAHYPLSNAMQYYGPFHAGVVWPLYADVVLEPLGRTWKCETAPAGDSIGEALENHTLDEALELAETMCRLAGPASERVRRLLPKYAADRERRLDLGLVRALVLQFESARDILAFYRARRDGDVKTMRRAALAELEVSRRMIPLCEDDSRLGFHSEAERHQYFPARLEWRIASLERTLKRLDEPGFATREPTLPSCRTGEWTSIDGGRFQVLPRTDGKMDVDVETSSGNEIEIWGYDRFATMFTGGVMARPENGKASLCMPKADLIRIFRDRTPVWPAGPGDPSRLRLGPVAAKHCGRVIFF